MLEADAVLAGLFLVEDLVQWHVFLDGPALVFIDEVAFDGLSLVDDLVGQEDDPAFVKDFVEVVLHLVNWFLVGEDELIAVTSFPTTCGGGFPTCESTISYTASTMCIYNRLTSN